MDYNKLKQDIKDNIRPNGEGEITGSIMQGILVDMVEVLGEEQTQDTAEAIEKASNDLKEQTAQAIQSATDALPIEKGTGADSVVQKVGDTNKKPNIAGAPNSATFGEDNQVDSSSNRCLAEGFNHRVSGGSLASHVENSSNMVSASSNSHVEGYRHTVHDENIMHVEGRENEGNAHAAHIEGGNNRVLIGATRSHTEGYQNTVTGNNIGHVEGRLNTVSGYCNHVEGSQNNVIATYGHVGGELNTVSGRNTFAHGKGLKNSRENKFTVGTYNADHDNTLFEVGGGTSDNDRRSPFYVTKDGMVAIKDFDEPSVPDAIMYLQDELSDLHQRYWDILEEMYITPTPFEIVDEGFELDNPDGAHLFIGTEILERMKNGGRIFLNIDTGESTRMIMPIAFSYIGDNDNTASIYFQYVWRGITYSILGITLPYDIGAFRLTVLNKQGHEYIIPKVLVADQLETDFSDTDIDISSEIMGAVEQNIPIYANVELPSSFGTDFQTGGSRQVKIRLYQTGSDYEFLTGKIPLMDISRHDDIENDIAFALQAQEVIFVMCLTSDTMIQHSLMKSADYVPYFT